MKDLLSGFDNSITLVGSALMLLLNPITILIVWDFLDELKRK